MAQRTTQAGMLSQDALDAMQSVVAELWQARQQEELDPSADPGISWVGFYASPSIGFESSVGGRSIEQVAGTDEMILICREPKPACSPIGLHGKCGHAHLTNRAVIVSDVHKLSGGVENEGYVACDPNDRSELVVPCVNTLGLVYAVLDLDSYQPDAFTSVDVERLQEMLVGAGLTQPRTLEIDRF